MHSNIAINSIKKSVEGYLYDYLKGENQATSYTPDISKTLSEQTLITAHNSMSNNFFKNIPFLNNILNSQDLSITNLLKLGIRGIDLDVYSGDMNPLYNTNSQQVAHSIGNHDFRIPIEIPRKLTSYLTEIKDYITQYKPKEPIFVFLENYDKYESVIGLEQEIKSIFKPTDYVSFPYTQDIRKTILKNMEGKVVFLAQNYDMPDKSPLNKATYSGLFNNFDQSDLSGVRRRKWYVDKDKYQLSVVNSNPINKFNQEDANNALEKDINIIKVDNIGEKDHRFLKAYSIYEKIQSKEVIYLPSAIIAGIIISTALPKQSRMKFVADFVAGIVLPFNGRVVYNLTRNGIESFDAKASAKDNILNVIKASIQSVLRDEVSQAFFNLGFGFEATTGIVFLQNLRNDGFEQAFYKAIDASTFGLTNFQKDVKKMEERLDRWDKHQNIIII